MTTKVPHISANRGVPGTALLAAVSNPIPRWPMVLAVLAAMLALGVNLGGTYMIYDDINVVQLDARVHSLANLKRIWTEPYVVGGGVDNLWRPLVSTSYAWQWQLAGDRPWLFHLVNILLHAAVAAVVARLGQKLVNDRVGAIAGVLFAIHPIHVEAVAAIVGRAELMCALTGLSAVVLALNRPLGMPTAVFAALLGIASAYCKEQGLVLPLILIPMLWARQRGEKPVQVLLAMVALAAAGTMLLREYPLGLKFDWDRGFLDFLLQPLVKASGADRWLIPMACVGHYFAVMTFPLHPSPDYGSAYIRPPQHLNDPYLWLGFAVLLGCAALAVWAARKNNRPVLICLLGLAVMYAPVSNFYMITGEIMAERLFYFPSVFLLLLLAMLLDRLNNRVVVATMAAIVPLLLWRTITYAQLWNDPVKWTHVSLEERPQSAWLAEAAAHYDRLAGHYDVARHILARACASSPESAHIWSEAGLVEFDAGNWALAAEYFDKSVGMQMDLRTLMLRNECLRRVAATRAASQPVK